MATMPPPNSPQATSPNGVDKAVDQVLAALSKLKKEAYMAAPDSPFPNAIQSVEMAVMEIGSGMGAPATDPTLAPEGDPMGVSMPTGEPAPGMEPMEAPGMEGSMEPGPEAAMEYGSPSPQPASIADAAGQTHDMMMAEAAKRRTAG